MAGQKIPDVQTFQEVYASIEPGRAFRLIVKTTDGFVIQTSIRKPAEE